MVVPLLLFAVVLSATDFPSAVATGDEAFQGIDYPSAITQYTSALQERPEDPEILWRLARACVCMGEVAEEPQRMQLFREAAEYARRCIQIDSLKSEGHTWLAGSLGYMAWYSGIGEQIRLTHELEQQLSDAIKLNPYDDVAYSIRGSFYHALGNVGWLKRQLAGIFFGAVPEGGHEESETALLKAISLSPGTMRHHYELGVLYLDMDRKEEAGRVLEHAATLPIQTAIDRPRLAKIKELLVRLQNERR